VLPPGGVASGIEDNGHSENTRGGASEKSSSVNTIIILVVALTCIIVAVALVRRRRWQMRKNGLGARTMDTLVNETYTPYLAKNAAFKSDTDADGYLMVGVTEKTDAGTTEAEYVSPRSVDSHSNLRHPQVEYSYAHDSSESARPASVAINPLVVSDVVENPKYTKFGTGCGPHYDFPSDVTAELPSHVHAKSELIERTVYKKFDSVSGPHYDLPSNAAKEIPHDAMYNSNPRYQQSNGNYSAIDYDDVRGGPVSVPKHRISNEVVDQAYNSPEYARASPEHTDASPYYARASPEYARASPEYASGGAAYSLADLSATAMAHDYEYSPARANVINTKKYQYYRVDQNRDNSQQHVAPYDAEASDGDVNGPLVIGDPLEPPCQAQGPNPTETSKTSMTYSRMLDHKKSSDSAYNQVHDHSRHQRSHSRPSGVDLGADHMEESRSSPLSSPRRPKGKGGAYDVANHFSSSNVTDYNCSASSTYDIACHPEALTEATLKFAGVPGADKTGYYSRRDSERYYQVNADYYVDDDDAC